MQARLEVLVDVEQALTRRLSRSAFTILAVALGVGALAASVSLTATAGRQIADRFDLAKSTLLATPVPSDAPAGPRLRSEVLRLHGVEEAGLFTPLGGDGQSVRLRRNVYAKQETSARIVVATPAGVRAREPRVVTGRLPGEVLWELEPRLALVGEGLAGDAGLSIAPGSNRFLLEGQPFVVAGVIRDSAGTADLTLSVVISPDAASAASFPPSQHQLVVRTSAGSTRQVASELPYVLSPSAPESLLIAAPADPTRLRAGIATDSAGLTLMVAAVALIAGALGIANAMTVSVMERRSEIGLRRALGASRPSIAGMFLLEGGYIGFVGGVVGACLGLLAAVAICAIHDWTLYVPWLVVGTPFLGLIAGVLAGAYPARRATLVEPVDALRS